MAAPAKPTFFASPARFDAWLARNGSKRKELSVGYWKVGTGKPSMTWPQSVEVALRHGWIDGVRRSQGDDSYCIRFTPRRPGSHWSAVNLRTAKRLIADGRMTPQGAAAYAGRRKGQVRLGSYEQRGPVTLEAGLLRQFKADAKAWAWFTGSASSYQKACLWWIQTAKRPETRLRRLGHVMAHAHEGTRVPQYDWKGGKRAGAVAPDAVESV